MWNVWKFDALTLQILCWCHRSLVLWPRVSISTLFTWSGDIWHSFRKSGAVCSRGFPFISSDDKTKSFLREEFGETVILCVLYRTKHTSWWNIFNHAIDQGWNSLIGQLSIPQFPWVKLVLWSLVLSSCVFLSLRMTRFFIWSGCTSFLVPIFHPCGTLVHAGEMYTFLYVKLTL